MSKSEILHKMENAWGIAPNPTKNLRFLDFPLKIYINPYKSLLKPT